MSIDFVASDKSRTRFAHARRSVRAAVGGFAVALLLLSLAACSTERITGAAVTSDWVSENSSHEIIVDGVRRSFLLHMPTTAGGQSTLETDAQPIAGLPLLLVLHGSSGDGQAIRESSQMDSLADARGFIVAYPNGTEGGFGLYPSDWNAGTCCGAAFREGVDDLGFISAVISKISTELHVDQSRIYIAGFSDGGRMAYHVACQLSTRIAAIAVVSGSLVDDGCFPNAAVPVLAIHGTSDDQVAFDEDAATSSPGPVPDMASELPSSVQFWVAENGCRDGSVTQITEHVVRTSLSPCGADVVLYTIDGGTHGWPGEPGADGPMSELRASVLIADFFAHQARR